MGAFTFPKLITLHSQNSITITVILYSVVSSHTNKQTNTQTKKPCSAPMGKPIMSSDLIITQR